MEALIANARFHFHKKLFETNTLTLTTAGVASNADTSSRGSKAISRKIVDILVEEQNHAVSTVDKISGQTLGKQFETLTMEFLRETFPNLQNLRPGNWTILQLGNNNKLKTSDFAQYEHLAYLNTLTTQNAQLAAALGNDYLVAPDVVVYRNLYEDSEINAMQHIVDDSMNPKAFSNEHRKIEKKSESPFEEAVAKNLFDCGYHIVQQWEVGAYRIDMVALYKNSAVAIECDGERWHSGEDAIRADMERQTILERLGWRFIRIRGSEYYRDTEQTMERVKDELSNYGIEPEETTTVDEESQNDTDLLKRVRQRAAMILESTTKVDNGNNIKMIEVALNPKALFQEEALPSVGEQPNELEEEVKEKATSEESEVEQTSVAPEQQKKDILELLQKHDVPYIDKRPNAGALWIVGGSELNAIVQEAKEYGCNFVFAKDGGKATKGKPGWWTK